MIDNHRPPSKNHCFKWLAHVWFHSFPCVSAVMGKAEGSVAREEWHGHVTALSVAPEFRRLGLAAKLMDMLEEISERCGIVSDIPQLVILGVMRTLDTFPPCQQRSVSPGEGKNNTSGCPLIGNIYWKLFLYFSCLGFTKIAYFDHIATHTHPKVLIDDDDVQDDRSVHVSLL